MMRRRLYIAASVFVAFGLVFFIYDRVMTARCNTRSYSELEMYVRNWIAGNWTKHERPRNDTALPDDISPDQIQAQYEDAPVRGYVFYTAASGGVAFYVYLDSYCGLRVDSERCPGRNCKIIAG